MGKKSTKEQQAEAIKPVEKPRVIVHGPPCPDTAHIPKEVQEGKTESMASWLWRSIKDFFGFD